MSSPSPCAVAVTGNSDYYSAVMEADARNAGELLIAHPDFAQRAGFRWFSSVRQQRQFDWLPGALLEAIAALH